MDSVEIAWPDDDERSRRFVDFLLNDGAEELRENGFFHVATGDWTRTFKLVSGEQVTVSKDDITGTSVRGKADLVGRLSSDFSELLADG